MERERESRKEEEGEREREASEERGREEVLLSTFEIRFEREIERVRWREMKFDVLAVLDVLIVLDALDVGAKWIMLSKVIAKEQMSTKT